MPQAELNSIPEQIHAEAVRQSQQQLERARRVAERHIAAAKSKVEEMDRQLQEELAVLLKHEVDRSLARAEIEARNKKLELRESVFRQVVSDAISKLASVPRDEVYEKAIHRFVLKGIKELGISRVTLSFNPQDTSIFREPARIARLKEFLRENLNTEVSIEVSPDPIECAGGVVVRSPDGRVSYYNNSEETLSRRTEEIRRKVERKVFRQNDG